jgi:ASC-1-like (ASCH) protein
VTIFNIHCDDPWFSYIRDGVKTVEGRKKTHSYTKIKTGDQIKFINGENSFLADVTEVREYASIEKYLEDVTLEKALPGVNSLEEALNIYYQWTSEEKIRLYGFLGIFVKPVSFRY